MEASRKFDKVVRYGILFFWLAWHVILVSLMIAMIQVGVLYRGWPMLLFLSAACSVAIWLMLLDIPGVVFDDAGIHTQILFRKRFYPWNKVRQAGILWRRGRGMRYNEIILLKEKGSPRHYKDYTFLLRNIGRTIPIPYAEETKAYIIQHYGPLDFDLSDGRPE